jgi:opacity protein-like surface antigen
MKRFLTIAVLTFLTATCANAQDIAGDWQGTIKTGMGELRLVLHVAKNTDGTLKASVDSPDQNAAGIAIDSITLEGNKLKFASAPLKASYEGTLKSADSISGSWTQGQKFPLDFKKTTNPLKTLHKPAPPSDIDGRWEGTLDMGPSKLRIIFRLTNTEDGLMAVMDSPDQKVTGMPSTSVSRKGSSIKIEMKQISGYFQGKIDKNMDGMSGDWNQGGSGIPLQLKRAKEESSTAPH